MSEEKPVRVGRQSYPELIPAHSMSLSHADEEETEVHLLDYWRILVARRATVIAVLLTVVVGMMIWTFKQTPIYRATTMIQVDRENANVLNFKDVYEIQTAEDDTLRTQYEVLKSRSLAKRVIEDLKLAENKEFKPGEPTIVTHLIKSVRNFFGTPAQPETDPLKRVTDEYLSRLDVTPVRLARLASVTFDAADKDLAATIINAHARHFIEQNLQYKFDATQEASEFLTNQLVGLKAKLEQSEDRLQEYSRANDIVFTEEGSNTASEKLKQLQEEYTKAQADRFQKESYIRLIEGGNADTIPQLMTNQVVSTSALNLDQLRRQDSDLAVTFAPEYPSRKRIRGQIEAIETSLRAEKDRVIRGVQAEYEAATERERLLADAVRNQTDLVNKINQEIIQYNILKRDVDSIKQIYDGLLTRLKEAGISAGLRASNIRIVDRAEIPVRAISPRKGLNLIIGILSGLVLGIGLALFEEYLDSSIKSADDVLRFLQVPTLGIVPKLESISGRASRYGYGYGYGRRRKGEENPQQPDDKIDRANKVDLIAHYQPHSLLSEAYRTIRTSLLLSYADRAPRTLLITSAEPSEGKTVTAANTAITLTQTGSRVVLIDAAMRKPRVHKMFGLNASNGLSSFLTGNLPLQDAIQKTQINNLFIIPCGILPPNPAELILSRRFAQMIQVLNEYFDYVIIDSPPLQNVSDGRIIAPLADGVLVVVKAFSTSRHAVKDVVGRLKESGTRIAGVILNDFDLKRRVGYYKYYSRSYYSAYLYQGTYGSNYGSNYVDPQGAHTITVDPDAEKKVMRKEVDDA